MSFPLLSKLPPQKCLQVISPETRVMSPEIQYYYANNILTPLLHIYHLFRLMMV